MGDKTFIEIPVLVNVLKGCPKDDPSDDQIKKWIKEANAILEDAADVHLKLDGITQDVGGTSCDINSLEDANKIEKAGRGELEKKYGKGKGYKIVVAGSLGWIEFAAGVTEHATDGTAPVSFIGRTKDGGELKKWSDKGRDEGQTIAHEFCHAVTLGPGHTIDKSTKADDKGHVPKKKQTDDEYKAN